jgi:hypothetical protein
MSTSFGQTISYTQKEDGFFYGTYNEDSMFDTPLPVGVTEITQKNVPFGPAHKIIVPGGIPPRGFIYDVKENVIFIPAPPKNVKVNPLVFSMIKTILYILSTSPRGLVKTNDPNFKKIDQVSTFKTTITVPDSFCLEVTPCLPELNCCNWITTTFGPNGLIILGVFAAICILIISSLSALSLIIVVKK